MKNSNTLRYILFLIVHFNPILGSNNQDGVDSGVSHPSNGYDIKLDKIGDFLLNKQVALASESSAEEILSGSSSYKFNVDDGNPDVHGNIERPCQAYDTFCIRKFFAEHSSCKISGRQLPDPFYRAQGIPNYPSANISAIYLNSEFSGLNNARVEEFFIDTVTDNLVIAFGFNDIGYVGNNTNIKFYLRGREPEVHQGTVTLRYEQITVTIVIPGLHNLRLDRAEITTYANNPILPFTFSPSIAASTNPEVIAMASYFVTLGVPTENLEQLSTEGTFFGANYLQYNICDFGLKSL